MNVTRGPTTAFTVLVSNQNLVPVPTAPRTGQNSPYLFDQPNAPFPAMSADAPRNGQQSVLAVDAIALMDALGVGEAIVGGFDWVRGRPTSWPRSGRSAAGRWCR